jgi:hypothetical protein
MTPVAWMGKLDRYAMRAYRNTSAAAESDGVAPLFCTAPSSSHRHAKWVVFIFQQFFDPMPVDVGLAAPFPV